MYIVKDTFGTRQVAWTFARALAWFPYCSEQAIIVNRITGELVAFRKQPE
jgi:hypothetical protein